MLKTSSAVIKKDCPLEMSANHSNLKIDWMLHDSYLLESNIFILRFTLESLCVCVYKCLYFCLAWLIYLNKFTLDNHIGPNFFQE